MGLDSSAFLRELKRELKVLEREGELEVAETAGAVVARAKALVEVGTGRLRDSIRATPGRDERGFYVDAGTQEDYALAVEFGTEDRDPEPFMRPAIAEVEA